MSMEAQDYRCAALYRFVYLPTIEVHCKPRESVEPTVLCMGCVYIHHQLFNKYNTMSVDINIASTPRDDQKSIHTQYTSTICTSWILPSKLFQQQQCSLVLGFLLATSHGRTVQCAQDAMIRQSAMETTLPRRHDFVQPCLGFRHVNVHCL
jgi:hypothetical protein